MDCLLEGMLGRSWKLRNTVSNSQSIRRLSFQFKDRYGPFVNGKEVLDASSDSKSVYKLHTPHSKQYLCEVENASEALTNHAIEVAHNAYLRGVWAKADVKHRANVLNNIAALLRQDFEQLLYYEVSQTGRPIKEMRAQVMKTSFLSFCI